MTVPTVAHRMWRRLGPYEQIAAIATLAILAVGAIVIGVLAYGRAGGIGSCVNNALGARNQTSVAQLQSTDEFSRDLAKYLTDALALHDKAAQLRAFRIIGGQADDWHTAVHAAYLSAVKHPLGRC